MGLVIVVSSCSCYRCLVVVRCLGSSVQRHRGGPGGVGRAGPLPHYRLPGVTMGAGPANIREKLASRLVTGEVGRLAGGWSQGSHLDKQNSSYSPILICPFSNRGLFLAVAGAV